MVRENADASELNKDLNNSWNNNDETGTEFCYYTNTFLITEYDFAISNSLSGGTPGLPFKLQKCCLLVKSNPSKKLRVDGLDIGKSYQGGGEITVGDKLSEH